MRMFLAAGEAMLIDFERFCGDDSRGNERRKRKKGASEKQIARSEKKHGVKLPELLCTALA